MLWPSTYEWWVDAAKLVIMGVAAVLVGLLVGEAIFRLDQWWKNKP